MFIYSEIIPNLRGEVFCGREQEENGQIGDYVLVHAGHAIEKINPVEAENTLEVFRQLEEEMRK